LFDLDGTLLDTLEDLAAAGNRALGAVRLPPLPVDSYRLLVGAGARNLAVRAIATAGSWLPDQVSADLADQFLTVFQDTYDQNWADRTRPYPGVKELLQSLRTAGCKLAVLSNKPDYFTQRIVSHFFPAGMFQAVFGKVDGWPVKPDPALALEICRQLAVDPAVAVLVGDSGSDMATAVNAGMIPVGVLWGFRSKEELVTQGARWLADSPDALLRLLMHRGPAGSEQA
jgi:phosphoglycolate phosphatase